ncbi:MAG: HIT family protein [Alphaproteobacteria bacterium]
MTVADNTTMTKFGYPGTLVAETARWVALVRPQQVTLGSLVLVSTEPARAFGGLSAQAFVELGAMVGAAEATLHGLFAYDKINYMMLMMVDPDVHFHVFPRYAAERTFAGTTFRDPFWPRPPDPTKPLELADTVVPALAKALRRAWPGANG